MPDFVLLQDPARYRPCAQDMLVDSTFREYWLAHFRRHFESIVALARAQYGPAREGDIIACRDALCEELTATSRNPRRHSELNLLTLDMLRQQLLHRFALHDPFAAVKDRENAAMLALYPRVVQEIDRCAEPASALLLLVEGVFAGNIFDLGASATTELFAGASPNFVEVRESIAGKRPWLVDQYEGFARRYFTGNPFKKAIFFLDNAGSDAVLGVLPFARFMAQRGTRMLLAANDQPALNDLTYRELVPLLEKAAAGDDVLRELLACGMVEALNSGGTAPLIDLRQVSAECNAAAADADLVFLEGMGRSLESNYDAVFRCDAVKLCMIKEPIVAERLGGKVFDVVFRYDAAPPR